MTEPPEIPLSAPLLERPPLLRIRVTAAAIYNIYRERYYTYVYVYIHTIYVYIYICTYTCMYISYSISLSIHIMTSGLGARCSRERSGRDYCIEASLASLGAMLAPISSWF